MSNSSLALHALEIFGELDDLAQVIYQGFECFVLLSRVSARTWTIHLGLVGEGRWWAGSWSGNDILQIAVRGMVSSLACTLTMGASLMEHVY